MPYYTGFSPQFSGPCKNFSLVTQIFIALFNHCGLLFRIFSSIFRAKKTFVWKIFSLVTRNSPSWQRCRKVWKSRGASSNGMGIICPPPRLVEIGLTHLPKSGGGRTSPCPPLPTSIISIESLSSETSQRRLLAAPNSAVRGNHLISDWDHLETQ